MTQRFGHEKLKVYQKGMGLAEIVSILITMRKTTANGFVDVSRVEEGRELLRRIAAMLTSLSKVAAHDS